MKVTSKPILVDVGNTPGATRVVNEGPAVVYYGTDQLMQQALDSIPVGGQVLLSGSRYLATVGSATTNVRVLEIDKEPEDESQLERMASWMTATSTDSRGETLPNGLRRWIRLTRPHGAALMPGPVEAYLGQTEDSSADVPEQEIVTSDEDSNDVWFNSTSASLALLFLANFAIHRNKRPDLVAATERFARTLIRYQWTGVAGSTDKMLRRGGFMLAASDSRTGSFGTGIAVRALLQAYKATGNVRLLNAAIDGCDYLMRCADPNTYWNTAYGVNPINRTVSSTTFYGFADRVDAADKISTVCTTWNLTAARALYEVGQYIGQASYVTTAEQARDFMAYGALNGYDFFAVQSNVGTVQLNVAIDTSVTSVDLTVTSPVALPVSYPYSLVFSGETMQVTGPPVGTVYPVTRGSSPVALAATRQAVVLDTRITASWTLSATNVWNDHGWHRLGDSGSPPGTPTGSVGTDQIEYGIASLYAMGYDAEALRDAYIRFRDLPHAGVLYLAEKAQTPPGTTYDGEVSDAGAFGSGYNGRVAYTGLFRLGRFAINGRLDAAVGTYYDIQGGGTLGPFKALEFPEDFELSKRALKETIYRGSLLRNDLTTLWSTGTTTDSTKRGAIVVAGAAEALLAALEGRP